MKQSSSARGRQGITISTQTVVDMSIPPSNVDSGKGTSLAATSRVNPEEGCPYLLTLQKQTLADSENRSSNRSNSLPNVVMYNKLSGKNQYNMPLVSPIVTSLMIGTTKTVKEKDYGQITLEKENMNRVIASLTKFNELDQPGYILRSLAEAKSKLQIHHNRKLLQPTLYLTLNTGDLISIADEDREGGENEKIICELMFVDPNKKLGTPRFLQSKTGQARSLNSLHKAGHGDSSSRRSRADNEEGQNKLKLQLAVNANTIETQTSFKGSSWRRQTPPRPKYQ